MRILVNVNNVNAELNDFDIPESNASVTINGLMFKMGEQDLKDLHKAIGTIYYGTDAA